MLQPRKASSTLAAPMLKLVGFFFGLAASSCHVFVTVTPCWYLIYAEASISPYENCYGLWKFCSSTGLCGKWLSGSLLGPHGAQRTVCRGLMITACLLSGFAMSMNIFGMKCILLFQICDKTKEKLTRRGAFIWVVAGTCVLIASTWYGLDVIHSAWEDQRAIELADGIFVGWGASGFSYAAAICMWLGAAISRRDRKVATKRRESVFATVAAYAASRRGSVQADPLAWCHLPQQHRASISAGPSRAREVQMLESIVDVPCEDYKRTTYM
ncbi:claudin-1-like [Clavelina lepadiformis]|uniref:claudin-1-like n=1 Tax=Clavelina lepadiformis TaxID=159417 RepID=UPI004041CBB2